MKSIINSLKMNKLLVLVMITYIILFVFKKDKAVSSVNSSMYYIIEMLEIMPVIFILTSILEAWIPKEVIMRNFGVDSGIKGSIFSLVLGSISAGPIYAAFPVCKMLFKKGASIFNIVIILSAWAVIKIPMLANETKFLGIKFMVTRWILTVTAVLIMAYIVSKIVKRKSIPVSSMIMKHEITGIEINKNYCVGCGICSKILPNIFIIEYKKAVIKENKFDINDIKSYEMVIDKCPVKAINIKA